AEIAIGVAQDSSLTGSGKAPFPRGAGRSVVTGLSIGGRQMLATRSAATEIGRAGVGVEAARSGSVVGDLITVVVHSVARRARPGMDLRIRVVAVPSASGEVVPVLVESLVDAAGAVVVHPVARLERAGMDQRVRVVAIAAAGGEAIGVGVGGLPEGVASAGVPVRIAGASPDDHPAAGPDGGVTRASRRSAGSGDGGPEVGSRVVTRSGVLKARAESSPNHDDAPVPD